MRALITKLKKIDTFQEGQKKKETCDNAIPDPNVDDYVVFYDTSGQPGCQNMFISLKQHCD